MSHEKETLIKADAMQDVFEKMGYLLFFPLFLFSAGSEASVPDLFQINSLIIFVIVFFTWIFSKFISGYLGFRLLSYEHSESMLGGFASIPKFFQTAALAYIGKTAGILPTDIYTGLIVSLILICILVPLLWDTIMHKKMKKNHSLFGGESIPDIGKESLL